MTFSIGTYHGGSDVVNNEQMGGTSALVSMVILNKFQNNCFMRKKLKLYRIPYKVDGTFINLVVACQTTTIFHDNRHKFHGIELLRHL